MATYQGRVEKKSIGLGGLAARAIAGVALFAGLAKAVPWAYDQVTNSNAPIEQGFVNPKNLSIEKPKNAAGNIEAFLQFKNGDHVDRLPCNAGYSGGVVCGSVDYLMENFTPSQREGVVVGQFPSVSSGAKRSIVGGELQAMLDAFYGAQKPALPEQQQMKYATPKK